MERIAVLGGLLALMTAGLAYAGGPSPGCCACFPADHDSDVMAFFCVSPTTVQQEIDAENRCGDIPDAELLCSAMSDTTGRATPECVAELQGLHIICPSRPGAPVLDNLALGGLVGLLGVVGFATLRRRGAQRAA